MKRRSGFEMKVLGAFAAAMLVVCVLAATTWKVASDANAAALWVEHTHEVLNSLSRARGDTLQIELVTQSYRITGDAAQLAERNMAMASREAVLRRIQQLTEKNVVQQERWMLLRAVVDQRMAIAREVELLRKTQGVGAASAFVATSPLKETRERVYRLLQDMEAEELRLLEQRYADQQRTRNKLLGMGLLVALSLCALLAATYAVIHRQLRKTDASQMALASSEENLATTLHSIGDGVLATDTHGRITRMNPVAEQLTGWQQAEALGLPVDAVFRIVHEQTRLPAEVPVALVLATGEVQELANHTLLLARDGSERSIADSAAPIRDGAGRIHGVVLVFRDETLARQARQVISSQNELLEQRVSERTEQLRESKEHLRSVINNVPALIAYVDTQQRYVYVNSQYQQRFAPGRPDIGGLTVREVLGEARYAIAAPLVEQVLQGQAQSYDWQPFPDIWQAIHYVPKCDAQNAVVGYYVLGADITERKLASEKIQTLNTELALRVHELEQVSRALKTLSAGNRALLRASHEQQLLDHMCQAIVDAGGYQMANVWYSHDDVEQSMSPMAECGYPVGLAALQTLKVTWADNERGRGVIATAIRTGMPQVVENMHADPRCAPWLEHLYGSTTCIACPLTVHGKTLGALAIFAIEPGTFGPNEVTLLSELADDLAFGISNLRAAVEQQAVQVAMHHLTRFDSLTGLPNQLQFTEQLEAAIEAGVRLDQPFAIMQTNIERLSEINDALGFNQGDAMLREFGARLQMAAPAPAVVARLRGDEFAMLLPHSDLHAATAMVQRLAAMLAQPFPIADILLDVSVRTGVALFPQHGRTSHDLYRHMDIAVHQAKKKGVAYRVFDPAQNQVQSHRLNMAGELRRAIEGGDLLLYLQPKIAMATGKVCGAEGLVRWKHTERGLMPPGEFIGLAEHTGLIKPLTEWVIDAALRLNHVWQDQGCALPIAVNLSARNLRDEGLLDTIRKQRATWGVAAGLLELEITESAVMDDAEFALRVLHSLRDDGIPLYIDDFGTGYSSLSYLQKLPVEYIKIDQSFVHDMATSKDSAAIVRSTIDLVHDLGRKAVAEGIETRAAWEQLAALGCDFAQGYYIARPMPAEAFPGWVQDFQSRPTR